MIKNIKNGADFQLPDGTIISNRELTTAPPHARSYAYCSDTMYKPDIVPIIKDVDILYHEATYLHEDEAIAIQNGHATALQAAMIAKAADVEKLVIGHFSARYKDAQLFEQEARAVFSNTIGGADGMVIEVPFRK